MTFEDMWKSLEEQDITGKYKQAREMADINREQLEFAYNSGFADAKAKYERPQGDLISREALRKAFHGRIYYFDKSSWDEANALIDNAPTVSDGYDEGYAQGYIDGSTGADMRGAE